MMLLNEPMLGSKWPETRLPTLSSLSLSSPSIFIENLCCSKGGKLTLCTLI